MTTRPFYTAEIGLFLPGGATTTVDYTIGAAPVGALSINADPLETSGTLLVSDDGYRTRASDPDGVVVYPALIEGGFQIDRSIPLSPSDASAAWGYGSLTLRDDGSISALMRAWNIDAQDLIVSRGVKTREDFQAQRSGRTTKGWAFGVGMVLTELAPYTLRWDFSGGTPVLLNEAASTNHIPNPRAEGASAGAPGTAPTGWSVTSSTSGLTRTIVGVGTEDGVPYIDVRYAGTATSAVNLQIAPITTAVVAAAVGQTWTGSAFVKLQAGTLTGVSSVSLRVSEQGGTTEPQTVLTFTPAGSALSSQRRAVSRAFTVSNTAYAFTRVLVVITNGATVDLTVRVGAFQLEQAAAASSVILPPVGTPAATTRAADMLYSARGIWTSPAVAGLDVVFRGLASPWRADEGRVVIPIRDATYWLDRPVQPTVYAGTGTHEGTSSMAGVPMPMTRGTVYNIEPDLIDPVNRVYRYNDAAGTVLALYERGVTGITFASDTSNLWSGSTPAGQYRTDNGKGLFQLGSAPVGKITIDATGQFPTAGNKTVLVDILYYLLSETMALPSDYLDAAGFTAAAAAYPYAGGFHVRSREARSALSVASDLLVSLGAKLLPLRSGALSLLFLAAIDPSETIAGVLPASSIRKALPLRLPADVATPPWRVRVGYQWNHTVQTDLSAGATDARRQAVAVEAQYKVWSDTDVLAAYRNANDLAPLGGALKDAADAQAVADRLGALWGAARGLYSIEVPISVGIGLDIGDVIHITYPTDPWRDGAYGRLVGDLFRSDDAITFAVLT